MFHRINLHAHLSFSVIALKAKQTGGYSISLQRTIEVEQERKANKVALQMFSWLLFSHDFLKSVTQRNITLLSIWVSSDPRLSYFSDFKVFSANNQGKFIFKLYSCFFSLSAISLSLFSLSPIQSDNLRITSTNQLNQKTKTCKKGINILKVQNNNQPKLGQFFYIQGVFSLRKDASFCMRIPSLCYFFGVNNLNS